MRPWTDALRALYPTPPGKPVLPDRPWWTGGMRVRHGTYGEVEQLTRSDRRKTFLAKGAQSAEAIDRLYPLPHPGFRVGQVWADADGRSRLVVELTEWTRVAEDGTESRVFEVPWMPELFPFLAHDAVCPWLAPWSPVEEEEDDGGTD